MKIFKTNIYMMHTTKVIFWYFYYIINIYILSILMHFRSALYLTYNKNYTLLKYEISWIFKIFKTKLFMIHTIKDIFIYFYYIINIYNLSILMHFRSVLYLTYNKSYAPKNKKFCFKAIFLNFLTIFLKNHEVSKKKIFVFFSSISILIRLRCVFLI